MVEILFKGNLPFRRVHESLIYLRQYKYSIFYSCLHSQEVCETSCSY